ncbi:tetratricopeptide repeat protein [Sphingomonas xanthus]|uniref:Tetratricopeptide repeat protein n=1 Tax=Sphingomonas xanthus TaxID=2594473 RepID=A0A516IRM0_9SPHN|nr:tetratricopeptide repeat protein [Sphingomonas xanthus]QDP19464.1 tetratricopeptide repeat protein [Sphingomonas xanthus]
MIPTLALLLLAAEPDPAPAPSPPPIELNLSLTEAGRAIEAGRLDQAKAMLAGAVAAGAKGEPVDRLLADLALARGENEQAISLYQGLLASHPDERLLLERAGMAAIKLGRLAEATALLDRATRQADAGWRAWNARGVAADRQGRWDEADAAYARAAALDSSRAEVANNQGWSLMLRGLWGEALAAFDRAYLVNPNLPRLANNRELARAAAAADLPQRRPGELDDAFAARLNDAGVAAMAVGQAKRAEAAFAQAIELKAHWYSKAADNLAALGPAR